MCVQCSKFGLYSDSLIMYISTAGNGSLMARTADFCCRETKKQANPNASAPYQLKLSQLISALEAEGSKAVCVAIVRAVRKRIHALENSLANNERVISMGEWWLMRRVWPGYWTLLVGGM